MFCRFSLDEVKRLKDLENSSQATVTRRNAIDYSKFSTYYDATKAKYVTRR